ncbi:MAG: bifunctional hydroxymethylpyrimidine kinase/phosphomethylpyrimidine kinase [Deltaproteobacteria bacterium]|nr:bifunctional hydroxymethylpyrimidine kinase/phosphomethylpyrimidine kinase [Deltaproteobacteria bacterium]
MSVLVVGSMAIDSVQTPFGSRPEALGGSATFFSMSASNLTSVRLVAVIGDDFPAEHVDMLTKRKIDLAGLQRVPGGKTFRWQGRYSENLNEAITLGTQLNVFADFRPTLPEHYRDSEYVFLANIHPVLQAEVLEQVRAPKLVALDTMNLWIDTEIEALKKVLRRVDMLLVNEGEARQLSGEYNIVKAARALMAMGPSRIVIKRGEYGALYFEGTHIFFAPAYPLESVFDPTGAGDTFAGGVVGHLARTGRLETADVQQAMVMGCVMGSFTVETFSVDRLMKVTPQEIRQRFGRFRGLTTFADLADDFE